MLFHGGVSEGASADSFEYTKSLIKIELPKETNQCKSEHREAESEAVKGPRPSPRRRLLAQGLVECALPVRGADL